MGFTGEDFKRPQTILEKWTFLKSPGFDQPLRLPSFTILTIPLASLHAGAIVYVSDGAAGSKVRYSNGTAWIDLG